MWFLWSCSFLSTCLRAYSVKSYPSTYDSFLPNIFFLSCYSIEWNHWFRFKSIEYEKQWLNTMHASLFCILFLSIRPIKHTLQKYWCNMVWIDVSTLFCISNSNFQEIAHYFYEKRSMASFIIVYKFYKGVHLSERW